MKKILITAFEPYGEWSTNSSWLTLVELTKDLPGFVDITTRLYPVDVGQVRERLQRDLETEFDAIIHLGQSPGAVAVQVEKVAVNIVSESSSAPFKHLVADGPVAYESTLPAERIVQALRRSGIPSECSFHAGTYLCNAIFYLSSHVIQTNGTRTQCGFVHLPLDPTQVTLLTKPVASMPAGLMANGIRVIIEEVTRSGSEAVSDI